jgi:hypothetical protein
LERRISPEPWEVRGQRYLPNAVRVKVDFSCSRKEMVGLVNGRHPRNIVWAHESVVFTTNLKPDQDYGEVARGFIAIMCTLLKKEKERQASITLAKLERRRIRRPRRRQAVI